MTRKIEDKNYVLIDVFDTIIFRRIHPHEVIKLWCANIITLFGLKIKIGTLFRLRIDAYAQLCANKEPDYEQLIREIYRECTSQGLFDEPCDFTLFLSVCREVEIAVETRAQYPNRTMQKRLAKLKNNGKTLIAVSDFYLSASDVSAFIAAAGFSNMFDNVFSSSDHHASKAAGDLYPLVLAYIGCRPDECVMIGDNRKSDIANAKKHGIDAVFYPNVYQHFMNKLDLTLSPSRKRKRFVRSEIRKAKHTKQPFLEYTVLFYVFTQRLYKTLREDKITRVAFLSREGLFLKKLFDAYQLQNVPEQMRIQTAYLQVSRRSIANINADLFRNPIHSNMSLASFLKSIGMYSKENLDELCTIAQTDDKRIPDFQKSEEYQRILNSSFKDKYDTEHKNATAAFAQYTDNIFGKSASRAAIVDVGWKGTMQTGLRSFLKKPCAGYYIGLFDSPHQDNGDHYYKGLIFSNHNNHPNDTACHREPRSSKSPYYDFFRINLQIYEQLLSAPHGGAVTYSTDENGNVVVHEDWLSSERALYDNLIRNHQANSFELFTELINRDVTIPHQMIEFRLLSKMVTKSSLFTTKQSLDFLFKLDSGFACNFLSEFTGISYTDKPKISIAKLLLNPIGYLRYFVKLERLCKKRRLRWLYYPVARLYYTYICIIEAFKRK